MTGGGETNLFVAQYSASGICTWDRPFFLGFSSRTHGSGVNVSSDGSVTLVGEVAVPYDFGGGPVIPHAYPDGFIVKFGN